MSPEKTYTLEDLREWQCVAGTHFAVAGHPVAHSLSPKMHNAAFAARGERDKCFFKFDIAPEDLPEALKLFFDKGFGGLNLTLPHKMLALSHLQNLTSAARQIGAANTLFREAGAMAFSGTNTDGDGFCGAVSAAFPQLGKLDEISVLILGAGGAARAIAFALADRGCKNLCICNRTESKAQSLVAAVKTAFPQAKIHCDKNCVPAGALLVNATSLGLHADDESPFPRDELAALCPSAVYDITYGAHVPALVKLAQEFNVPASDGRAMLAWQGAMAENVWLGVPAELVVETMLNEIK